MLRASKDAPYFQLSWRASFGSFRWLRLDPMLAKPCAQDIPLGSPCTEQMDCHTGLELGPLRFSRSSHPIAMYLYRSQNSNLTLVASWEIHCSLRVRRGTRGLSLGNGTWCRGFPTMVLSHTPLPRLRYSGCCETVWRALCSNVTFYHVYHASLCYCYSAFFLYPLINQNSSFLVYIFPITYATILD